MGMGLIKDSTLADIAAAIREKAESTGTLLPGEMAAAIRALKTFGGGYSGVRK